MGIWIAIAIALFVLGSMMALKPSGIDQRLDKLRMSARRLDLNPKLVPCPDWVSGQGMIAQYGLVLDGRQLPYVRYQAVAGHWRADAMEGQDASAAFALDNHPIDFPDNIAPFAKALVIKANSIVLFWEDIAYVRPATNPSYQQSQIEPDLLALKSSLEVLAQELQQKLAK